MLKEKKKNIMLRRRAIATICFLLLACIVIGVICLLKKQKDASVEFMYQGLLQDDAKTDRLCSTKSWRAKDIGLRILDQGEDVSEEILEVKSKTDMGMDITYTWNDQSFILHVIDENYEPPVFKGPKEIEIEKDATVAKNFSVFGISAKDSCGNDVSDRIESNQVIDTSVLEEQEIVLTVQDDTLHKSEYSILVRIVEKKEVDQNIEYHDGIANPLSIQPEIIEDPEKIDVLVNKFHALPDTWVPDDLVTITSNNERSMQLREEAAKAFEQMNAAALQDDITIRVISAYRTKDYQQSLFSRYYADDPLYAYRYSALPRRSEHETGLAIDVSYDASLYTDLHTSDLGKWMDKHAHEYGFMLRFLQGKELITNYAFEPWHYRYVGSELATKIKASGQTMEEYYGSK